MAERDLSRDLDELARVGEAYASPLPAERVRELGQRRRNRRRVALVSAVAAAVVVAGGAVATTTGLRTSRTPDPAGTPASAVPAPTPSGSPSATPSDDPVDPPAARGLSIANLPAESDLEWQHPGDWKTTDTYSGVGEPAVSRCFALGPSALPAFRRDFRLLDGAVDQAGAVVLEFANAGAARAAYATVIEQGNGCRTTLEGQGYERIRVGDWLPVELAGGEAQFIETSTEVLDDPTSDDAHFGAYGVVRTGDRLAVVAMDTVALDNNWSYAENDPTGLPRHPMFRTLPKVADRLRS